MRKIAIIGSGKGTILEAIVKAVEEKTGEKVELVNIHSKDMEVLTTKHFEPINEPVVLNSDCNHNQFCDQQTIDMKCKSKSGCNFKMQSDL